MSAAADKDADFSPCRVDAADYGGYDAVAAYAMMPRFIYACYRCFSLPAIRYHAMMPPLRVR